MGQYRVKFVCVLTVFFCALWSSCSYSAQIIVNPTLSFGTIAVRGNNSVSSSSMSRAGNQTATNLLWVIEPGQPAEVMLVDFPAYTTYSLSSLLPATSGMSFPGTAQFRITHLDMPAQVRTDANGDVSFVVGGTLETSGNGLPYYSNSAYFIYLDILLTN